MALPEKRYSVVDRLNYKVTTTMLCLFAVLIAGKLHWGESLNCIPLNTNLTDERFVKYAENYCARGNTYRAGFDEPLPLSAELRAQRLVIYHKWIPVVFIAMASLFLAPKLMWTPDNGHDSESPITGRSHTQSYFAFKEAQTMGIFHSSIAAQPADNADRQGQDVEMNIPTAVATAVEDGKELSEDAKIRLQQDREYAESLANDRKKRQAEEDKKLMERIAERDEKSEEERRNRRQTRATSLLLPEPALDLKPELVITVQARTPGGEVLTRRFERKWPLLELVKWLESLGFAIDRHLVFDSAHVEVCQLGLRKSFAKVGWTCREQVSIVEK